MAALIRFLNYSSYLQKLFGLFGAISFMFFYVLAKLRGDKSNRLHYIPVGPYVFYFPLAGFFAGLFNEIFFKEEYYLDNTSNPLRVLDCGANIGVSLLYIKLRAPHARVTCFEPNPAARAILERNIKANGWQTSVTVEPYALGAKSGKAQFSVGDAPTDSGGRLGVTTTSNIAAANSFEVSVEPLSRFIAGSVDFLKLDIEGAEFDVLEEVAASGALRNIASIQLEYHQEPGFFERPLSDLLHLLEAQGFVTAVQSVIHPHFMQSQNWRRNCMVYAWREA